MSSELPINEVFHNNDDVKVKIKFSSLREEITSTHTLNGNSKCLLGWFHHNLTLYIALHKRRYSNEDVKLDSTTGYFETSRSYMDVSSAQKYYNNSLIFRDLTVTFI